MAEREVTIPEPTTLNAAGVRWGLIEWVLESMTQLADTYEGYDIISQVVPKLLPLKGPEQGGKKFIVTQSQLDKLIEVSRPRQGTTIAAENLLAVAGYLQALRTAKVIEEKKPETVEPKSTE